MTEIKSIAANNKAGFTALLIVVDSDDSTPLERVVRQY